MKFAPYSYSKISTHDQCNRKFKYANIDKAPRGKTDRTALLKGGAVHSILENYPEKSTHKLAPDYQHIADKFISTELGQKYLTQNSSREISFGLTENFEPCSYSDKEAMFRGFIDFICFIDDMIHIIDWKTGKYRDERWQDYNQLLFYAIFFFIKYPNANKIKISYVYVEHENTENSLVLDRQYLQRYISELTDLINAVETDEVFAKSPSGLCQYCDFREHCENDNS